MNSIYPRRNPHVARFGVGQLPRRTGMPIVSSAEFAGLIESLGFAQQRLLLWQES
jgi:hypothetical protein